MMMNSFGGALIVTRLDAQKTSADTKMVGNKLIGPSDEARLQRRPLHRLQTMSNISIRARPT